MEVLTALAKTEGVSDAAVLTHIGGLLPTTKNSVSLDALKALAERFGPDAAKYVKWGGRALVFVAVASDLYDVYKSDNKARTITTKAAGWAAAGEGAAYGAGVLSETGPGAVIGAIVGGAIGYYIGEKVTETVYDWIFTQEKK